MEGRQAGAAAGGGAGESISNGGVEGRLDGRLSMGKRREDRREPLLRAGELVEGLLHVKASLQFGSRMRWTAATAAANDDSTVLK